MKEIVSITSIEDGEKCVTTRCSDSLATSLRYALCGHRQYIAGFMTECLARVIAEDSGELHEPASQFNPEILAFFDAANKLIKAIDDFRGGLSKAREPKVTTEEVER